jgi:two-component system nitrogen regulation sensor histidine kinase GlnL
VSETLPLTPTHKDQIAGLSFGMVLVDPDNVIREVNPAAENLIGRSSRRLVGLPLFEVLSFGEARVQERFADVDAQLIARGITMRVDNRQLPVNLTISGLPTHPGWHSLTLSDAIQGERFGDEERRGSLRGPAVLAHEIKNPLSAIKGAAQLLARKLGQADLKLTDLIADEVDRIAQLIDRMQRLGREQSEPVRPINLHEAVRRACDTVKAGTTSPFILREEFDPSLPAVLANEGALVQVLVNLISNAGDACNQQENPEVIVRTRFVSGLVMNVFRLGRPVKLPIEVQVSDNGPGIDPAVGDHIFEPFVSTKKNGQGLGLALVHKLVRDMNGRITHERDEAAGLTHFRVHLPMAKQEEA